MNRQIAFVIDQFPTHIDVTWISSDTGEPVTLSYSKYSPALHQAIIDEDFGKLCELWDEEN